MCRRIGHSKESRYRAPAHNFLDFRGHLCYTFKDHDKLSVIILVMPGCEMGGASRNLREELIEAGIDEISRKGIQGFSIRRAARACGVSCATPYKYFGDRQGFVAGVVEYINGRWARREAALLTKISGNTRKKLLAVSMEYIKFLVENPHFRSILMMKDESFDLKYGGVRSGVSRATRELIERYCREVRMPARVARLKVFIVRSLIFGAALMFDNNEIEYNEDNLALVSYAIDREFDLA